MLKSNIKWRKIYELTRLLGLNSIDVEILITDKKQSCKQVCLTDGPPNYLSTMYGTISIKDFKLNH
ncbi:MAG: hypothetical protein JSU91_04885 [Thermoplasmatales archaeon]|nr:MAG: hypothetical protein JSU91_04885 [Thermoplasmatales archaeon]